MLASKTNAYFKSKMPALNAKYSHQKQNACIKSKMLASKTNAHLKSKMLALNAKYSHQKQDTCIICKVLASKAKRSRQKQNM